MNDLEYRRKQLLRLQDSVIDLEDLSSGISIADLTHSMTSVWTWRTCSARRKPYSNLPFTSFATTQTTSTNQGGITPGVIFCLKAVGENAAVANDGCYPLAPNYLVHVSEDSEVLLNFSQTKQLLDRLRTLCVGKDLPDAQAIAQFNRVTKNGSASRSPTKSFLARPYARSWARRRTRGRKLVRNGRDPSLGRSPRGWRF